jgi:hypothetical protein
LKKKYLVKNAIKLEENSIESSRTTLNKNKQNLFLVGGSKTWFKTA